MRMIIHDLENISFLELNNDDIVVDSNNCYNCVGCFSCWVKHPFKCILNDKIKYNGKNLYNSDKLVIISKCVNGCYSSKVKKVLERSISYVQPFFTIRNNEVHHKERTNKKIDFDIIFYGEVSDVDVSIAQELSICNMNNLNSNIPKVYFVEDISKIKEVL